jgi:hypothetical protein
MGVVVNLSSYISLYKTTGRGNEIALASPEGESKLLSRKVCQAFQNSINEKMFFLRMSLIYLSIDGDLEAALTRAL